MLNRHTYWSTYCFLTIEHPRALVLVDYQPNYVVILDYAERLIDCQESLTVKTFPQ